MLHKFTLILAFCLISSNFSYSQAVYIRFSERDCINCNISIHAFMENSKDENLFKLVFPSNFKGKKFEKFNKIYFKDVIKSDAVVFSDELSEMANSVFDNKSGVFSVDEVTNEIIYALNSDDFALVSDKKGLLQSFSATSIILDYDKEGVSDTAIVKCNFDENKFVLLDPFFRTLYVANGKQIRDFDFNQISLTDLIQKAFTERQYKSYLENKNVLEDMGVNGIAIYEITYVNGLFYIHLGLPEIVKTQEGTRINYDVYRPSKYVIISEDDLFKGKIFNNIYTFDITNKDGFVYSIFDYHYKGEFYKINNSGENKLPNYLLSEFKIDKIKKEIVFEKYKDKLLNPFFEIKDTEDVVYPYYGYYDEIIFGGNTEFKTIIDVASAKMREIDVQGGNINQIWKNAENHYVVLVTRGDEFRLIEYAADWEVIKTERLYINGKVVSGLRFTKNNIYIISNKGVYSVSTAFFNL